jgi:hypothetical protein
MAEAVTCPSFAWNMSTLGYSVYYMEGECIVFSPVRIAVPLSAAGAAGAISAKEVCAK